MDRRRASHAAAACLLSLTAAAVLLFSLPTAAQRPASAGAAAAAKGVPRMADGRPDLEGIWTNATIVPLQRPEEYAGKSGLTEQEAAERGRRTLYQWDRDRRDGGSAQDLSRAYGSVWWDADAEIVSDRRTALVVDPPDGRLPPLTAEAQARLAANQARLRRPAETAADRTYIERC